MPGGRCILLPLAQGQWPSARWVLEVPAPGLQRLTLRAPRWLMRDNPQALPGNSRPGFHIDAASPAGQPLRLWPDQRGAMAAALRFGPRSEPDYLRQHNRWLAIAWLCCCAVMLSMAALAFAWRLREATFPCYAGDSVLCDGL
ncbi:hypothetical protein [Xanthomonas theicola]|uniref:Uncharacterized protein n=1 Tax=Xanthomonas theicola TaxID=56464 RepID=A0A2S6ZAN7_9XANT|nr:hypothetical protein [Xanthomonas theicola]PPT79513.1 hypothetical protein XthCFBP4691_18720 [Xanthomonas theicola]QNH23528.1 hypothetical protein G4Q83_00180 [Xanthomonas theicola]